MPQNIGDFDPVHPAPDFVDVDATVNIFPSNTRPTTTDVDETPIMAVEVPFEEDLCSFSAQMYCKILLSNFW